MLTTIKRFYSFLFRYKKTFFLSFLVLLAATIIETIPNYIYKVIVDTIPSFDYLLLLKLVFIFVGTNMLANLLQALSFYLDDRLVIPSARDARIAVFKHIQNLDFAFHVNKNTGALISAFKRGDSAFFALERSLNRDILAILINIGIIAFFFYRISPSLALTMIGIFAANMLASYLLIRQNLEKRKVFNASEDKISGIITDNLLNYETVKFFSQEQKEEKRLTEEFKKWIVSLWNYGNSFRIIEVIIGTLSNLGILAIFWIVVRKLVLKEIGVGDLVLVIGFITNFYHRFFHLFYQLRDIAKHYIDIEKYLSILDNDILIKDPRNPVAPKDIKGAIKFEEISFSYPNGKKNALAKASFNIKQGESVALVGRSGAGKTTAVKLLLRFYDPEKGKISIDNIDIKTMTKQHLRSFMGVVPQEPILFNNTVAFNIGYGNNRADKDDIIKATKLANLHDFIQTLPSKYETQVGERGVKLSGGQKQRLAIARMILTDPKIIIFDEATSNLDSESEKLIQDALWKIAKDRTIIIIAHRFSTVRQVNKIIVLDDGKIVETGSHRQLMTRKGIYHYLWNLQSQGKITTDLNPLD